MTAYLKEGAGAYDAQQSRDAGGGVCIAPLPVNPYRAEIEEFGRAVLENRSPIARRRAGTAKSTCAGRLLRIRSCWPRRLELSRVCPVRSPQAHCLLTGSATPPSLLQHCLPASSATLG